jgi:hypothetical protein
MTSLLQPVQSTAASDAVKSYPDLSVVVASQTTPDGPKVIPAGTNGTVVGVISGGTSYLVAFGPPVSAVDAVSERLLAVA